MTRKGTIEEFQALAANKGGRCLSTEYRNKESKLEWECSKGHTWLAIPNSVKRGSWCPTCNGRPVVTLEDMHRLAEKRGGACLSKEYLGDGVKLWWQCEKGHKWDAIPSAVKRNSWCPQCVGKRADIAKLQRMAAKWGGRCLSTKYVGALAQYEWECTEGHRFPAQANNVLNYWCPKCAGNQRLTLQEVKDFAQSVGLECLSETYTNNNTKMLWRCAEGHVWPAVFGGIQQGNGCPKCSGVARVTLEELQELAGSRGGECLASEIVGVDFHVRWRCGDGHEWEAVPASVKAGRWCAECQAGFSERACRALLERLTGWLFPKLARIKIPWLVNSRGKRMELDGYSEEIGVAFEYNGRQHYDPINHFYRGDDSKFRQRQEDDANRRLLCEQHGVRLIEIPHSVGLENIEGYLRNELKQIGVSCLSDQAISLESISHLIYPRHRLREMREIAARNGGALLSETFMGFTTNLRWRCSLGHEWESTPANVKRGAWCKSCSMKEAWKKRSAESAATFVGDQPRLLEEI